jgi:hypothetical protein
VRGQYTDRGKGELGQAGSRAFDGNGLADQRVRRRSVQGCEHPDGRETESSNGDTTDGTGHAVISSAYGGAPGDLGVACSSVTGGRTTLDWQLTISASGNFSLVCHFGPIEPY